MRLTCTINGEPREVDGALGGRVAAVRAARAAGAAGLQERLRAGRVRLVLGVPGRRAGVLLPGRRRAGRGARGRHRRRARAAEDELHPIQEAFLEAGAVQCGFCTPGLIVATHDLLARNAAPSRRRDPRGAGRQPVPLHGLREDPRRGAAGGAVTHDRSRAARSRRSSRRRASRRARRDRGRPDHRGRPGPAPAARARAIDASGCLATPGLDQLPPPPLPVGHARAGAAGDAVRVAASSCIRSWARIDAARSSARPRAPGWRRCCARAARRRPTTTTSSRAAPATCWASRSRPRASSASASTRAAARWTSACRRAGCRRTTSSRTATRSSPPTTPRSTAFHDPSPGSMLRIALAPCSPFSVTRELMAETAELARSRGVRLHTHMAETVEEEAFCLELFGVRPVEYLEELGWLGDDVWLAHCVHLSDARGRAVRRDAAPASRTARPRTPGWARGSRRSCRWCARARRSGSASTARRPTRRASWAASCARRCWSRGCAAGRRR